MKKTIEQAKEQLRKNGNFLAVLFADLKKYKFEIFTPSSVDFLAITVDHLKETTGKDYTPGRFIDQDGNTYSPEDLAKLPRLSTVLEIITIGYIKDKAGDLKRVAFGIEYDTGYNESDELTFGDVEYYNI